MNPSPSKRRPAPLRATEMDDASLRLMLEALAARMAAAHRDAFLAKMAEMDREKALSPVSVVLGRG